MEALSRERERVKLSHVFHNIISVENLLLSWQEFLRGKRKRKDVAEFSLHLMDNILELNQNLLKKTYKHGSYLAFAINDPKPRNIHKAPVRDRLLHHAVYRILYPYFDRKFIYDSYSCRIGKGTHRAIERLRSYNGKASENNTKTVWVLKCDVRKFFSSINHGILKTILRRYIDDRDTMRILSGIIDSFNTVGRKGFGLPLGNLTSQLFINIYLNELDQFIKRKLKVRYYIRYADDFIILYDDDVSLYQYITTIGKFLKENLNLELHPDKVFVKTFASGVDFLGWVNFPHHRLLRTSTKKRMFRKLNQNSEKTSQASYLGLLKHGNTYKLAQKIKESPL